MRRSMADCRGLLAVRAGELAVEDAVAAFPRSSSDKVGKEAEVSNLDRSSCKLTSGSAAIEGTGRLDSELDRKDNVD